MRKTMKVVALDIHKESTTVALAGSDRKEPRLYGEAISKLVDPLGGSSALLRFCYEAGPCGYGVYRQLTAMGHECTVVAPSLIPRRPGDRIKTDRRDALALARLHRNGELTPVWVPDEEQEAMRDLERCREDMKHRERHVRQRLNSFFQRHSRRDDYGGVGDITRFDAPRQLMAFVGLAPSEHCSGGPNRRHQAYKPSPGKRRNGCVDGIVISRRVGCRRTKLVRPSHGSCWVSSGP